MPRPAARSPRVPASTTVRRSPWWVTVWRGLGGVGGGRSRRVLVLFAGLMLVTLFPILELGLKRLRRNAGRVLEHAPASEHAGPYQSRDPHDTQHARELAVTRMLSSVGRAGLVWTGVLGGR